MTPDWAPRVGKNEPDTVAVETDRVWLFPPRAGEESAGSSPLPVVEAEDVDEGGEVEGVKLEGGLVSINRAFSRIDLPSLYFWDCSYARS